MKEQTGFLWWEENPLTLVVYLLYSLKRMFATSFCKIIQIKSLVGWLVNHLHLPAET